MIKRLSHTAGVGAVMAVLATGLLVAGATPALADTSQATAQAAKLTLLGGTLVDTGVVTASNDGTQPNPGTVTGNTNPGLSVLGAQTLLTAGLLVQQAAANNNGTSAACAGVVGAGGTIQIGPAGNCLVQGAAPGGVVIDAGALLTVSADAILAQCTAASNGPNGPGSTTASATLVNAQVKLAGVTILTLPVLPAANGIAINLPPAVPPLVPSIIGLTLNKQVPAAGPGVPSTTVTALDLNVLGTVLRVELGKVTCGPNAITPAIPMIPLKGLPISLATAGLVGVAALVVHRRRRLAATEV